MKEKKTAVITFRTEEWVKDLLETLAEQNRWSIAQTVNEICKEFVTNPQPGEITIKTTDLINVINEIIAEGKEAVEISISNVTNADINTSQKTLHFGTLESGGMGACYDFDAIKGMTPEEILNIP